MTNKPSLIAVATSEQSEKTTTSSETPSTPPWDNNRETQEMETSLIVEQSGSGPVIQ